MTDRDRSVVIALLAWLAAVLSAAVVGLVADEPSVVLMAAAPPVALCARLTQRRTAIAVGALVPIALVVAGVLGANGSDAGRDVAVATALLVATGIAASSAPRPSENEDRRATLQAIRTVHSLVDEWSPGSTRDATTAAVAKALADVLQLKACWFEPGPVSRDLPEIRADGDVTARIQRRVPGGLVLPALVALPVRDGDDVLGRFVLEGDPEIGLSPERRTAAVVLADVTRVLCGRS